jgi:hypothetical protein
VRDAAARREVVPLALAVGSVGIGACASLIVFFAVGGPFGFINDVGNAVLAVLTGALAVTWLRSTDLPSIWLRVTTAIAVAGVAFAVVGSVLVIFDITGYFLAGLVSASGFALIGAWIVAVNVSAGATSTINLSSGQGTLGVVAGSVMAIGIIDLAGVAMGIDDMDAAPGWLTAAGICWMGTYLLMPVWSIWLARSSQTH